MTAFSYLMTAPNGWVLEDGTSANTTTKHIGIFAREDTVIAEWKDEDGKDLLADLGLAGKTLFVSDPAIYIPNNRKSSTITLTSGSVGLIR